MNQRERYLAIGVGVLLVVVVGWFVQGWIAGAFDRRQQEITKPGGRPERPESPRRSRPPSRPHDRRLRGTLAARESRRGPFAVSRLAAARKWARRGSSIQP